MLLPIGSLATNGLQISEGNCRHKQIFKLIINNNKMKTNFKFKTQLIAFAYVLLAVVFLVGCDMHTNINKKTTGLKYYGQDISVFEIDSCEYVYISNGNASWGSHKGNCKFCLQRLAK